MSAPVVARRDRTRLSISFEVVSIGVETDSGRSLLIGEDWDPIRVRDASATSASAGAFSVRTRCFTISRVVPVTAVAVATCMDRVAAAAPPQRVTHDCAGRLV
jgi:hypothetical protein